MHDLSRGLLCDSAPDSADCAKVDSAPHIAFIDSDDTFRTAMAACLRTDGFSVREFDRFTPDIECAVSSGRIDAVLLDAEMTTDTGVKVFNHILPACAGVPVALLAKNCTNRDEEAALARGAADYLAKSRGPTVVTKRIRLLIGSRNASPSSPIDENCVSIGPLTLRLESHRALWHGRRVSLTVTEFKIVRLLAAESHAECSHRQIYDVVHGSGFAAGDGPNGYRTNVRSLIRKIRARFRKLDKDFNEIENVAGYGYRWRTSAARPAAFRAMSERASPGIHSPVGVA
jgi:two-component system response regulator ChvI